MTRNISLVSCRCAWNDWQFGVCSRLVRDSQPLNGCHEQRRAGGGDSCQDEPR
jgi:hypothetical protein